MTSVEIYQSKIEACYPKKTHVDPTKCYCPLCNMILHWAALADEYRLAHHGEGILDQNTMVGNEWLRTGRGIQGLTNHVGAVEYDDKVVLAIIAAIFENEGE